MLFITSERLVAQLGFTHNLGAAKLFIYTALSPCPSSAGEQHTCECGTLRFLIPSLSCFRMDHPARYMAATEASQFEIIPYPGLSFGSAAEVEAAGITWLELADMQEPGCQSFVIDFKWRESTLAEFFSKPTSSTKSALAKIEYEVEKDCEWDSLKFRTMLW